MRILMGPVNIAGQPITLVNELQRLGVDVSLLQYGFGTNGHPFKYQNGTLFDLSQHGSPRAAQAQALKNALDDGTDIFHLWMSPLFASGRFAEPFFGLDLLFIKARARKLIYRSTGFDVRRRSLMLERNPYASLIFKVFPGHDEAPQSEFMAMLADYADRFIAQDPEMAEYLPKPTIIPRSIDLSGLEPMEARRTDRPLIVHAPSKRDLKGSNLILAALSSLSDEGITFDVKLIENMPHTEALDWYRKADICVDQILIGWYGVAAMEFMALGKPTVAYVRPDLLTGDYADLPIHNADPDTLKDALRGLITDYSLRRDLGVRGRQFVERIHDVRRVAPQLLGVYKDVYGKPATLPSSSADIDYFIARHNTRQTVKNVTRQTVKNVAPMARHSLDGLLKAVLRPVYQAIFSEAFRDRVWLTRRMWSQRLH